MTRLFGTDGVRGIAGNELTCNLAMNIGKACAHVLTKNKKDTNVKVIIGNDGRESADMLVSSLIAGLCPMGIDVVNIGTIPTPAISYLVKYYRMDAGIMVTASHNPYYYNGIKIFDKNGYKLSDELEDEIEKYINEEHSYTNTKIGKLSENKDAVIDYSNYLLSCLDNNNFSNLNIAIDCANGASSKTAEYIYSKLGCQYHILNHNPNGQNINDDCGSLHIENLSNYIKENNLDGGVAFDGDADRAIFVDELGNILDGDYILAILGLDRMKQDKLSNNTIVGTVMSNLGFVKFCKDNNMHFISTKVGDRYVLEEMNKGGYSLGGEQSGHIIIKDYANTGDGELTSLKVFEILSKSNKKFSELSQIMKKYPQITENIQVENERKNEIICNKEVQDKIEEVSNKLKGNGRVLVRPSGTEPLIRVMIEAEDLEVIQKEMIDIVNVIKEILK